MGTPFLLGVLGPTASGKSALAERIADENDAQLLNVDAFQVYRGLNIGTGKSLNYARYALIDIKDPNQGYGVGEFIADALVVLHRCFDEKRSIVAVGGTGLYMRALFEQYGEMAGAPDPELRAQINALSNEDRLAELLALMPDAETRLDTKNPIRVGRALERIKTGSNAIKFELPAFQKSKVALLPNVDDLNLKIYHRVHEMVQNGWVREVETLLQKGYSTDDPGFRAIGYRTMAKVISGEIELEEATATTIAESRRYAKRQRSWLRSEPNLCVTDGGPGAYNMVRSLIDI